jgi:hypothetical protein
MLNKSGLKKAIGDTVEEVYKMQFKSTSEPCMTPEEEIEQNINLDKKVKEFRQKCEGPIADAIEKYLKAISIIITIPPTIISPIVPPLPGGPCTGVINPQDITIS